MAQPIIFFEKSAADIGLPNVTATASQGSAYAINALNRSNSSAWVTTGSVDADNTTFTVDFGDAKFITDILLVKHNFKAFTVQYSTDNVSFSAFSAAISESNCTAETSHYEFTQVEARYVKITITGTQTANEDKELYQFIATRQLGQLAGWPQIRSPKHDTNKKKAQMLSGKLNVTRNVGGFFCELSVKEWRSDADMTIVETLYNSTEGFLVWLCGGSESQFSSSRIGYRLEDIYLMKCANDYEPEFVDGGYYRGLDIKIQLAEVVT